MKTTAITLTLAPDEAAALEALAKDQYLDAIETAAAFVLRDALIALGYLAPPPDIDESSETVGEA